MKKCVNVSRKPLNKVIINHLVFEIILSYIEKQT